MGGSLFRASPSWAIWAVSEMPGVGCRVVQVAEGPPGVGKHTDGEEQRVRALARGVPWGCVHGRLSQPVSGPWGPHSPEGMS